MIRAQDQDIQSLVADIRDGKLLLPEMQRRYVWKSTQIRDLFDSLYHEYPSGQLPVWETDDLPAAGNRGASIQGIITECLFTHGFAGAARLCFLFVPAKLCFPLTH